MNCQWHDCIKQVELTVDNWDGPMHFCGYHAQFFPQPTREAVLITSGIFNDTENTDLNNLWISFRNSGYYLRFLRDSTNFLIGLLIDRAGNIIASYNYLYDKRNDFFFTGRLEEMKPQEFEWMARDLLKIAGLLEEDEHVFQNIFTR